MNSTMRRECVCGETAEPGERFCKTCLKFVYAVKVGYEEYHFVADTVQELQAKVGEHIFPDQCDECGCTHFLVEKRGPSFVAVCDGDEYHTGETREGCGAQYIIIRKQGGEVVFD